MKVALFAFLILGYTQLASAEDSVSCANGVSVAWTDDSTINVTGLRSHQELRALEILQRGDRDYIRIVNDKTVIKNSRLLKVKVTVDTGTSVRSVLIFDWSQFSDGNTVPVEFYHQYPNGDLEFSKKIECAAAQS